MRYAGLLRAVNVGKRQVPMARLRALLPPEASVANPVDMIATASAEQYRQAVALTGADPNVDVVVEVIGGVDPARALITQALEAGKPVVTANKELIARHGPELFATAASAGVDLLFEASVAGGIPRRSPMADSR